MTSIARKIPSVANYHSSNLINKLSEHGLKDKIVKYGVFGSSVYSREPNDIDILLIIKNISNNYDYDLYLISEVEKRMRGDHSFNTMVQDERTYEAFNRVISEYSKSENIYIENGIGPSTTLKKTGCWIHLNGPMTEKTWNLFAKRFPLHATSISYNYFSIIGSNLDIYKYNSNDIRIYIQDMRSRFLEYKLTPSYTKKIIKATAMLLGEKSCDLEKCKNAIISKNIINSNYLNKCFLKDSDLQENIVNDLLEYIEIKYKVK